MVEVLLQVECHGRGLKRPAGRDSQFIPEGGGRCSSYWRDGQFVREKGEEGMVSVSE
jgi:hypothetical protein